MKQQAPVNNNLLIAAANTNQNNSNVGTNEENDGDNSSDGGAGANGVEIEAEETDELKQRKRELIIARQLERRHQQEMIRLKREEERMRKAEEVRSRDEEAAQKKALDKTRKEVIFQAYIEKKKQAADECSAAYFGHPNTSLMNAKRFHSTLRLKQQQQKQQLHNNMDQFDQASLVTDRSVLSQNEQSPMMKSKIFLLFLPKILFLSFITPLIWLDLQQYKVNNVKQVDDEFSK